MLRRMTFQYLYRILSYYSEQELWVSLNCNCILLSVDIASINGNRSILTAHPYVPSRTAIVFAYSQRPLPEFRSTPPVLQLSIPPQMSML